MSVPTGVADAEVPDTVVPDTVVPDEAILDEARSWLRREAPAYALDRQALTIFPDITDDQHAAMVRSARAWEAHKAAAGWAGLAVPTELGGQGRSAGLALEFEALEEDHALPLDVFAVTRGMVLPTILAWGTPEQRGAIVPAMLDGTELWCQLFSEPGAGSDLAAVATRATPVEGGWRITGQKVWTSFGHDSDRGYLLARTDPAAGRYAGLTAFVVSMHAPGVDARPITQATGAKTFSEVFFDDVLVGDDAVLGAVGGGWKVVHTTLMNERLSISSTQIPVRALYDLLAAKDVTDPVLLDDAARVHADKVVVDAVRRRLVAAVLDGEEPGPEGSLAKILVSRGAQRAGDVAARALGPEALLEGPWQDQAFGSLGLTIGGGTEEILKSLIGERVLGLPREPRPAPA